jgi:hypothetical protein
MWGQTGKRERLWQIIKKISLYNERRYLRALNKFLLRNYLLDKQWLLQRGIAKGVKNIF